MSWLTQFILTIVMLDLLIYFQHVVFHKVEFFWPFHKVHHSDTDFDATTAVRFHPIEIALSMLLKVFFIIILGADPLGYWSLKWFLMIAHCLKHGNVSLPEQWERIIGWFIVTPDMHRIHHSVERKEADSNYGYGTACLAHMLQILKTTI